MASAEPKAGALSMFAAVRHTLPQIDRIRFYRADIGVYPLVAVLPFMYYPKILGGDTQPWVLMAAVIALFAFRTKKFCKTSDVSMILLAIFCVFVFAVREGDGAYLLRSVYGQVTFVVLWIVCGRERGEYFPTAIRITIVVWLVVGLYQSIFVMLGLPVDIAGRFVEGRGGVPSLTSEPSMYGSISMLHLMYLLSEHKRKNNIYIAAAAVSVVLSGSLLALLLFAFPLMKLNMRLRLIVLLVISLLLVGSYVFATSGLALRVASLGNMDAGIVGLVVDPSINLRIGHLYFTLVVNFVDSILMLHPISFMEHYNFFAVNSVLFIETGSEFILPAIGEIIYSYGAFGAVLLFLFFRRIFTSTVTTINRIEKAAFILACMVNPITLSNAFLIIYARQTDGGRS